MPSRAQPYHRSATLPTDLANTVEGGGVRDEEVLSGGMIADTRLQTYANGRQVVRKTAEDVHDSDAEQVVSLMARALGLDAPEVYRNDPNTVHMTYADGDIATERIEAEGSNVDFEALIHTDQGRALGLLDLLTNNGDRHMGNWLLGSGDDRIIPIDHGMTFPDTLVTFDRANETIGFDVAGAKRATFVKSPFVFGYMSLTGAGWKANDLAPGDVAVIRDRLQQLRPDFEQIGRGAWLDFALARLDVIGDHATGTTSRLLSSRLG